MIYNGEKYGMAFNMDAIIPIWEELNIRTPSEAIAYLQLISPDDEDAEPNMVVFMKFLSIVAFYGIESWCRSEKKECPFSDVRDLQSKVKNYNEITQAAVEYTKSINGFFQVDASKGKKAKAANQ